MCFVHFSFVFPMMHCVDAHNYCFLGTRFTYSNICFAFLPVTVVLVDLQGWTPLKQC